MTDANASSGSDSGSESGPLTGSGAAAPLTAGREPVARAKAPRPKTVSPQPLRYTLAIVLSAIVIPLPIFAGLLTELIVDTANPSNIDVTQPAAYLGAILGIGFGVLGAILLAIVVVYTLIYRREHTLDALKLPLLILAIQVVLGVLILLFNALINNAG